MKKIKGLIKAGLRKIGINIDQILLAISFGRGGNTKREPKSKSNEVSKRVN